ncbi:hypothetical protein EV647_0331 [Kribbella sp. VKM Ac-2566]|nr:hypothetical protein EV647_0331 [Kribbella sp. VKM Ac-2566]
MNDRIRVSWGWRLKWLMDDVREHSRLVWRLYVSRMYSWNRR